MSTVRVLRRNLVQFCADAFRACGADDAEAFDSADILVTADARGIGSHGTARLRRYVRGMQEGTMVPGLRGRVLRETPLSLVIDAEGAMGLHLSKQVMGKTIDRAKTQGAAFAAVRDSNHFGIAGYYAQMALPHDMIGVAMTNTAALGVPTFGRDAFFGTNPLAVAVPALTEAPFVLDMAATVVTRGKVETYAREKQPLPENWAVGTDGNPTSDAEQLLEDMFHQLGGGILPLGGVGEQTGGHKGYGLAVLVDVCTALLSGGTFGQDVVDLAETSGRVCHFFAAIRLDLFRDPMLIKQDMDSMLRSLRQAPPAAGSDQVFYAGLKEYRHEQTCAAAGVPLPLKVWQDLLAVAEELELAPPTPC